MNMNFDHARYNMVEQQIRTWEVIDDRVLSLLETIEREDFVPVRYRKLAFADLNVPLAHDQVMQPDETALEIGTGSGFITACLARLARHVVSVEVFEDLSKSAKRTLKDKEVHNLELFVGDALGGWQPEQAHDVLVVTGSVPAVPEHFKGWVNPGGRLFIVTGNAPAMNARLLTRINASEWREESLFETDLPRLVNAEQPPQFEF